MSQPTFRPMTASDAEAVIAMMAALYAEDPSGHVSPDHFRRTVEALLRMPERGRVVVFDAPDLPRAGYAILIAYWSNEFGGNLAWVDEVYVRPEARSRGLGRAFFEWVDQTRPFEAVAAMLEVTPRNTRAMAFYLGMGFNHRTNATLVRMIGRASG